MLQDFNMPIDIKIKGKQTRIYPKNDWVQVFAVAERPIPTRTATL